MLFSLKPFAYVDALALMAPHLDGFATSSLFEARLASRVLLGHGSLHLTTPGMRPDGVGEIASLCDFVSFNSLSQYQMHGEAVSRTASCGLRVNPQMSFVDDERYDPCRPNSKLGFPSNSWSRCSSESPIGCRASTASWSTRTATRQTWRRHRPQSSTCTPS